MTRLGGPPVSGLPLGGLLLATVVIVAGACASAVPRIPDPVIDGLAIGDRHLCSPDAFYDCGELAEMARVALDRRYPNHAAIESVSIHAEGDDSFGLGDAPRGRSGTVLVTVFEFADGSVRAVPIHCGVGGCWAMDPA